MKNIQFKARPDLTEKYNEIKEFFRKFDNSNGINMVEKDKTKLYGACFDLTMYHNFKVNLFEIKEVNYIEMINFAKDHVMDISLTEDCPLDTKEIKRLEKVLNKAVELLIEEYQDGRNES